MAEIIPFPGTKISAVHRGAKLVAKAFSNREASASQPFPVVRTIRARGRIPKQNRAEDQDTILHARLARSFADRAYELAQTEPNSEDHRLALHMAGIERKLPRNNLRIFTTEQDRLDGIWSLWRRVRIANIEWELCDERRWEASSKGDEESRRDWEARQDEAEAKLWREYERLIRVPASRLSDVQSYKLDRRFHRGVGSIEWMRTYKPDLAAIIDEELARFNAEKSARKAERDAKKGGR